MYDSQKLGPVYSLAMASRGTAAAEKKRWGPTECSHSFRQCSLLVSNMQTFSLHIDVMVLLLRLYSQLHVVEQDRVLWEICGWSIGQVRYQNFSAK